jgi:putative spermidine/putrescine transport system ATP-binding protein
MHCLRGTVRDGHLEVPGGRIPWRAAAAGGEVEVLFRPESVSIVEAGSGELRGRIVASFFLGDRTRLVVSGVGASPLILETAERREFAVGQEIHLRIDPAALLTLDR